MEQKRKTIEWHPAFTASLQIEFEDEADKIIFESEHLLSKKPMQIDELVIKVHDNEKIQKNIGRIFRKHNICLLYTSFLSIRRSVQRFSFII